MQERTFKFDLFLGNQARTLVEGLRSWHIHHGVLHAPDPDLSVVTARGTCLNIFAPGTKVIFSERNTARDEGSFGACDCADRLLSGGNPETVFFEGIEGKEFLVRGQLRHLTQLLSRHYSGQLLFFGDLTKPKRQMVHLYTGSAGASRQGIVQVVLQDSSWDEPHVKELVDDLENLSKKAVA